MILSFEAIDVYKFICIVSSALQTLVGQPCWLFIRKAEDNKHLRNAPLSMESRKLMAVTTDVHDVN